MALDTKEKRANVIGVGRPWMRDKLPVATPDEQWRIASGNAYGGNALSAAAVVDYVTTRISLVGTSRERHTIRGAALTRVSVVGTSAERHTLTGSSR